MNLSCAFVMDFLGRSKHTRNRGLPTVAKANVECMLWSQKPMLCYKFHPLHLLY